MSLWTWRFESSSGHQIPQNTHIYIGIFDMLWQISYQISPKFRTKLASVAEVFSTLSTKCSAQHAQLIHLGRVESVFAQRIEQLMPILLLLSKHPFVVKTCHLAHRFSQTCLTSLSCLCGAAVAWVQAELTLTGHYRVSHSPLRCISIVVQASINRIQPDEVSPWH